jgi:hypothetical protein
VSLISNFTSFWGEKKLKKPVFLHQKWSTYFRTRQLSILDTMGKLVYQSIKPPNEIDLRNLNLNNSMYYAVIETTQSNFNFKIFNQ